MTDKAFIDAAIRLSNLYQEASKESFPVKANSYPIVTDAQVKEYEVIYGLNAHCDFPASDSDKYKAVSRLHQVWEQALLRRLGEYKNVNGKRIMMLFLDQDDWVSDDYECVYPA